MQLKGGDKVGLSLQLRAALVAKDKVALTSAPCQPENSPASESFNILSCSESPGKVSCKKINEMNKKLNVGASSF